MSKSDETEIIHYLRSSIAPIETAGSSLAATYNILKSFHQHYNQKGCKYLLLKDNRSQDIMIGIGISTFAGLPFEEKVGEFRDFINPSKLSESEVSKFILTSEDQAILMGYRKLYINITKNQSSLKEIYLQLGYLNVEDQSSKFGETKSSKLLFKSL